MSSTVYKEDIANFLLALIESDFHLTSNVLIFAFLKVAKLANAFYCLFGGTLPFGFPIPLAREDSQSLPLLPAKNNL